MSDLQIISLIESEKDEKWKFALQLLGTYGLRHVELKYLKIKEGIEGKELWCTKRAKVELKEKRQNQED